MCSRQVRTLDERCAGRVGEDLLRLADVDDDLRADGDRGAERRDGGGLPQRRLELVPRLHPVVEPAVEDADVLDAGVGQDERRARGGDLTRAATWPLLVRAPLGVAAVEDDGRVVRDAEALHRLLELGRRAAVPVDGVLEPVRVEVEGAGEVALLVLLGDAEVDVEEEEAAGGRRLRPLAVEHGAEPVDVDEALVPRKPVEREGSRHSPKPPSRRRSRRSRSRAP